MSVLAPESVEPTARRIRVRLGGRLVDAVLDLARELGLERVTVHSSDRAVPAYRRHGFASAPTLLHTHLADRGRRERNR